MTEKTHNGNPEKDGDEKHGDALARSKRWEGGRPVGKPDPDGKLSEKRIRIAMTYNQGFCIVCEDWTRLRTEHDAEDYPCPKCQNDSVHGAATVLLMTTGLIDP